eukprot:2660183-Prymnesium_polylepis.1
MLIAHTRTHVPPPNHARPPSLTRADRAQPDRVHRPHVPRVRPASPHAPPTRAACAQPDRGSGPHRGARVPDGARGRGGPHRRQHQ